VTDFHDDAFTLTLPCGRVAVIDRADLPLLEGYLLFSDVRKHTVYVRCKLPGAANRNKYIYLHRLIVGAKKTDHENGNGLDCRRKNLRPCNDQQNAFNKKGWSGRKFKGVYPCSWNAARWRVYIAVANKDIWGGVHESEEGAARAYDELALKYHGEFARLNFPEARHVG
jgi:hypothetical protein